MKESKRTLEVKQQIKIANYKIIMNMQADGWCTGCNENVDNCLRRGKCKGQEDIENAKKSV